MTFEEIKKNEEVNAFIKKAILPLKSPIYIKCLINQRFLNRITGEYATPAGYMIDEKAVEVFSK